MYLFEICINTNTLYITIIVVFLSAFLHVLVYLVLRYPTGMTLIQILSLNFAMLILSKRSRKLICLQTKESVHGKWIITIYLMSFVGLIFSVLVSTKLKIGLKVIFCMSFYKKGLAIFRKVSAKKSGSFKRRNKFTSDRFREDLTCNSNF